MWSIFHSVIGVHDEKVTKCEQMTSTLKIVKRKYRDIPKNATLDDLCGNKFSKNEITAIKCIMGLKILEKWREFKEKRLSNRSTRNKV